MALRSRAIVAAFLFLLPTLSSGSMDSRSESPRKLLMAVLGDSISAATLADVPIPGASDPEERVRKWAMQGKSSRFIFENKELSWASGTKIDSQFRKLRRWLRLSGEKRRLDVLNTAFPQDKTTDMREQAEQVVRAMSSGKYDTLEYVTVLVGADDACTAPVAGREDELEQNLMRMFERLASIAQSQPIRILLVGIPRIPNLGTPGFRRAKTVFGLSCETVRNKILGFCNSLLLWNSPSEYDQDMKVVEDMNRVLRVSAEEANGKFRNLEVVYSDRLYDLSIPLGVLAADCFHPGRIGQQAIADQTWLDQPWFGGSK